MASSWQQIKLGQLARITMGQSPKGELCNSIGEGVPLLNGPTEFGSSYPTATQFTTDPKRFSENGDLLFCVRGSTTGRMNWSNQEYAIGRGLAAFKHFEGEDYKHFLRAIIEFKLPELLASATGSTFPNVSKNQLNDLEIFVPPLPEQKAIAHILGTLDDKIELNRQMNETLEAMAQALFKSWFVDFDPVIDNALLAGNDIPNELAERAELRQAQLDSGKANTNSEINDLFPSEFEFTEELGWIPHGWESGVLADICSYGKGKINTSELTVENYVSTENMNKEKAGISYASSIASTNQVPKFSVGQTLISNIRPYFKKIWLASFSGGRSNDVLSFQAHNSVANEYLFNLLYQDSFFDYMTATSKGTKMPRGDKAAIMSWSVAIPSSKLMEEFSELAKPMYLANNLRSLQTIELAKLRDTLLPKLMSGELRIPDAARLVDEII